jgi:tetratricopeptide (TPR) repeat protein
LEPLGDDEAMALFTTRSRQVKPDFGAEEASATRALVRLLDGLPLAIELAAARSRVMSPSTLLARMSERFALLSSRGGRPGRHATLRGVLDWSWDLLSPDEQAALGQLSVFEGGFTLEAAEGVLSLGGGLWAADGVQALVDKSLVRQVGDGRFHLLASVHAYASEQLDTSADRASAEARHWAWFARMGTVEALDALDTHGGAARNAAMAREFDNLVLGCRRAAACGVGDVALALLRAVWAVLVLRGPLGPGLELAERVTGVSGLTGSGRGIVHRIRGAMLHRAGQPDEASVHFEAALAVARETGDRELESAATWYLGTVRRSQGRTTDAAAHYAEALAIAREMGDRWSERAILVSLGVLHLHQGRNDEARACLQAGLSAARASGDHRLQFIALGNLGNLEMSQGAHAEASASFEAALTVMRSLGDHRNEGVLLASLGTLNMIQGRSTQAQAAFERALEIARSVGLRSDEAFVLAGLGRLYLEQGRRAEAREHLVAALAVARETAYRRYEGSVLGALGELGREEGQLEASRADFDAGAAILRAASDRIELGRLLCGRALLRLATGDRAAAEEDLAEAETLTAEAGVGADAVLGRALAKARAEVGGATGTESA